MKSRRHAAAPAALPPPEIVVDIAFAKRTVEVEAVFKAQAQLMAIGSNSDAKRLLRDAHLLCRTPKQAVEVSIRASALDPDFVEHVSAGDYARDMKDWENAENRYEAALSLFPLHPGYLVQCGHVAKERGRWTEAEVNYRSAWALGAPPADVLEHLLYVVDANLRSTVKREAPQLEKWDQCPPNRYDIAIYAALLFNRAPSIHETLHILQTAQTLEHAATIMIQNPDFARRSRSLIDLLKETT